jgi:hypothetical protein
MLRMRDYSNEDPKFQDPLDPTETLSACSCIRVHMHASNRVVAKDHLTHGAYRGRTRSDPFAGPSHHQQLLTALYDVRPAQGWQARFRDPNAMVRARVPNVTQVLQGTCSVTTKRGRLI